MKVGSKTNLFPLSKVSIGMHGYFIDVVGTVWSTRKTGEPQKLAARNGSVQLSIRGSQRSFSIGDLLSNTRVHPAWNVETGAVKSTPKVKPAAAVPSTKAVKPSGWIIGTLTAEGSFSFSATPKVQSTESEVTAELERLAKANPGKTFVSFKIEISATAGGVVWG